MSPAQSNIDVQSFSPGLDLSRAAGDAETQAMQADSSTIHVFPLGASNDVSAHGFMDTSHFGDFHFPYQSMHEDTSMISLSDDHGDLFGSSHRPSISSLPERQNSVTSITVAAPGFPTAGSSRRRASADASDGGSRESSPRRANSFDDPMSDDFGLSMTGPGDGTDMGGKVKEDKPDAAPAWSELKTKAGKERKRLPLACIACRRKKIRCSGEKPACKHCLRSRIPCVYKVTTRKAAPRTDYMAMLDKRLKRMEERIIKVIPKNEQDAAASSVTRANVKPAIPGTLQSGKSSSRKRPAEEAFGADLDHWARSQPKSKLDGCSKSSSLLVQETEESKLLLEGSEALPSRDIQEHLAEVFFDHIYGQAYHILHKPSYMRKLRAGTLPPVLILSVCAVSARFSSHPKWNSSPNFLRGEEWASHAREIVTRRYEWPNITILTCLLILGLHEFGTCHGGRSWALGGQAIRMAFALQLHRELDSDPLQMNGAAQLSFTDREIRRRTMWACFLMDRFNSSGTDRPTFIKEETIKIQLPCRERYFMDDISGPTETLQGDVFPQGSEGDADLGDAKSNMGVAAYMIRAIAVWGRISNYLNQGGKEQDPHPMWSPESEYAKLIKQTEDVLNALPEPLRYSTENLHIHDTENRANQFLFLHIAIQQNILFMNRFAVSSPNGHAQLDAPKAFVTKAGAKAFAAANRVSDLLRDAEKHFVAAPFVGYCAFLSSTVHIFGSFSGNPTMVETSKKNLASNVKFLSKMKRYWGMFHWMSEDLQKQYRTCADARRQGTPASENASSPIFQYGDWFSHYPHGVSHADFVDPATYKKKERGDDAVLEQKPELHTVDELFTTLSPQSSEGRDLHAARPMPIKRKSMLKKSGTGSSRSEQQALEPLLTDLPGGAEHMQQRLHQRIHSGQLGGQTSGPTSFSPLSLPPQSANSTSYHALSPISPVAISQFSGHVNHPGHGGSGGGFYGPDMLTALSLQHQANGLVPQLDRQLAYGAYAGLDPGSVGLDWPHDMQQQQHAQHAQQHAQAQAQAQAQRRRHAAAFAAAQGGGGGGGGAHHGPEASSAWFLPFNMEPPEIGVGGIVDGFGPVFGSGMTTPTGMSGGLHHGGR